MRYLPLLSSLTDPAPWPSDVELLWEGDLHAGWSHPARAVHAMHLPPQPFGEGLLQQAGAALRRGLQPDFLVIPVEALPDRSAGFALLGTLEMLLEVVQGRVKLALRVHPEAQATVLTLLREARAEAVGFCFTGGDPEPLADRLWCAVGGGDLAPLRALGYRWNVALPAEDPEAFRLEAARLAQAHPAVLFPERLPDTMLGRPVVEDPSVTLGAHWERP
ncbi:MAG TPA: hypothetical protein VJ623_04440 [Holophagaceae bacterium]|nr:hypothetical protein [Holophagaceae bacterium]